MQDLVFERRTFKSYLVTVPPADLVVGRVYFRVVFLDEDMVVPVWTGLVFLGRDLNSQLPGLYFQDAESFFGGERASDDMWASALEDDGDLPDGYSWVGDETLFEWEPPSRTTVCEYEHALEQLLACSLRRQKWDGTIRPCADRDDPSEA